MTLTAPPAKGEAQVVISADANPPRFQDFANRIVASFLGRPVLGTTLSRGDQGVDGRAVQLEVLQDEVLVAASVRKDAVAKMKEDAKRLAETQPGGAVYFCTTVRLTEPEKATARDALRKELGDKFAVTILAETELIDLAVQYRGPLEDSYRVELAELRERIANVAADSGGSAQLQIAHALTSPEGLDNRDKIADQLIGEVVARQESTANEVAAALQALLRMPAAFPRYVIDAALERLSARGLIVARDNNRWAISDTGRAERLQRSQAALTDELSRKERFAHEVTARLGYAATPELLALLWKQLMTEMSELLVRVGARFVALVEAALANSDLNDVRTLASDSVRAACRKAAASISDAKVREETEEALFQSLLDEPAIALAWLEEVIGAWIAACQLGLVPEISEQLRPAIAKLVLALDTDVVLSLLCEAEPDNAALSDLLAKWSANGGRTLVSAEVLREVAHHAWIARTDFNEVASILRKHRYDPGLARYVTRNAFVRSFWESGRPVTTAEFERYIRSFIGDRASDYSQVEGTLARLPIGTRTPQPTDALVAPFRNLEAPIKRVLTRTARYNPNDRDGGTIESDKIERDATSVAKYAAIAHSDAASINSVLLLSSSKRLAVAVRQGAPHSRVVVAPTSTLGLLLSSILTRNLRPQSIAQLLLAEGARTQVSDVRRESVRMLARADLLTALPRARVASLEREVETAIVDYAKTTSRLRPQLRKEILTARDKDAALQVFGTALRKVAIGAEADQLIRAQLEELDRLRKGAQAE
jgi:hypothetical protein